MQNGKARYCHIWGCSLLSSDSEQARTYYHYVSDEKGSITHLISSEEERVLNEYSYDVFGNRTVLKETVDNLFGYTGQQYDGVTGQYYLRARYYNPVIGRFIQEDTYYGDGLNLYAYCCNNPVMYYDPTGHDHEVNHNPNGHEGHHNPDGLDVADSPDAGSNNGKKTNSRKADGGSGNGSDKPDANESKPKVSNDGTDSSNRKPEADMPDNKPSQGGSSSKTYMTGKDGEKELANMYGGRSQAYFMTTKGKRFIDQLANGIAHESKVGYTTLTERVKTQILKDAELIKTGQIKGAHWHFFTSGVTGKGGASQPLLDFLSQNGIKYTIH